MTNQAANSAGIAPALFFFLLLTACTSTGSHRNTGNPETPEDSTLFHSLSPDSTHISFSNTLQEGLNTNVLLYEYFYNGGGVAIGDFNGDGLQDIYFTGNMSGNKLYLNRGHLHFEDITEAAGVAGRPGPWKTGVAVADINGDGRPDLFLCYSGKVQGQRRIKQLFINEGNDAQGIPRFSEQAARYGLADSSYTTMAYFFDYDHDGDLDLLLLNHNPSSLPVLDEARTAALMVKSSPGCGIRLLRNDQGHFKDVTELSGIGSSELTYGLGAGIADIDGDGWPDIYISNDYNIPDYYYVNDHHGKFINKLHSAFGHTSRYSMGNTVADVNNDALPDIFTLDMLPEDHRRQQLLASPNSYDKFSLDLRCGFGYQYMRNMLQLNNGNGTFSETGQLAGIAATDWSWAPLFADYDNDGWKDLLVTNGYLRDYTDQDFIQYMAAYTGEHGRLRREDVLEIIQHMPASHISSYLFRNDQDGRFTNTTRDWGIRTSSNSNGAVWADLDNDGDLDLVVNNVNHPAFVYENRSDRLRKNHYLSVRLQGAGANTAGIGAKLTLYSRQGLQYLEQMPTQGFQSTVSTILHFGLGKDSIIDSLRIVWPLGREQLLRNPAADRQLTLNEKDAMQPAILAAAQSRPKRPSPGATASIPSARPQPGFITAAPQPLYTEVPSPIMWRHPASDINDYQRQSLMVNPQSFQGPCLAHADVNGDGLEDIYTGGGNGQPGALWLQTRSGKFEKQVEPAFDGDRGCEDADAVFFDANGDGKPDLYVASGGYHRYQANDPLLQDRLYLGDGHGHFTKAGAALPPMPVSKGCIRIADINGDGFPDCFVGGRVIPGEYPSTPASYLLINDGHGHFTDRTATLAPELQKAGMITDAAFIDLNGDHHPDLIVAGEWMPIQVFVQEQGIYRNRTKHYFDKPYSGWWNRLLVTDLDGDGRPELLAGNLGLNAPFQATETHPADLYYRDFDNNGTLDPIFCTYIGDTSYPWMTRDELLAQFGNMSKRFPDYASWAGARLQDLFPEETIKTAGHLQVNCLETLYFSLGADGVFHRRPLPLTVQYAPVYNFTLLDAGPAGKKDLLLTGNRLQAPLRMGRSDAGYGLLLRGDGQGHFSSVDQRQSGFRLRGDVRSVLTLGDYLFFGINQSPLVAYRRNPALIR